jgi:hypothetical protein
MKTIVDKDKIIAIYIDRDFKFDGIKFLSDPRYSQQVGYMSRPKGYSIPRHIHNRVERQVFYTQEVLFVKSGCVQVELYNDEQELVDTIIMQPTEAIFLVSGGHGFTFLEESELIECKQGPYAGDKDKRRF